MGEPFRGRGDRRRFPSRLWALAVLGLCAGCGPGFEEGDSGCKLENCTSGSFDYTCATADRSESYAYCGSQVSSLTVEFSNGHTVTCTFSCSLLGDGQCHDDGDAECSF